MSGVKGRVGKKVFEKLQNLVNDDNSNGRLRPT
jgi:hypothetical protein